MMEQMTLFDDRTYAAPLASRLRPAALEEFAGQEHLLGKGKMLRLLIERDQITSMIAFCGAQRPQMRFRAAALRSKTATRLMQVISC